MVEDCPIPCQNNAQCIIDNTHGGGRDNPENAVFCQCAAGYSGGLCETRMDTDTDSALTYPTTGVIGVAAGLGVAFLGATLLLVFLFLFLSRKGRSNSTNAAEWPTTSTVKANMQEDDNDSPGGTTTESPPISKDVELPVLS